MDRARPPRYRGTHRGRSSHRCRGGNSPLLLRGGRRHAARLHPDDAAERGIEDGAPVRLPTRHGAIELPALLTDGLARGVVAVSHGWGHKGTGRWRRANAAGAGREDAPEGRPGGVNVNLLMSSDPADLEPLAGMAHLDGVPVQAAAVVAGDAAASAAASVA